MKSISPENVRTPTRNLILYLSRVKGVSKEMKGPEEIQRLFLNDKIIDIIVENIHIYMDTIQHL